MWLDSEGTFKETDKRYGLWIRAQPFASSRKAVITVSGFYIKNKDTPKAGKPDGLARWSLATKVFLKRTQGTSQTNQETTESVEAVNANSKNSFLTQNGQAGHDQLGPDLAQLEVSVETLEKQIEEIDRELSKFDLPGNEIHEQNMDSEDTSLHYTPPPLNQKYPPLALTLRPIHSKTLITLLNLNKIPTRSHHHSILLT